MECDSNEILRLWGKRVNVWSNDGEFLIRGFSLTNVSPEGT